MCDLNILTDKLNKPRRIIQNSVDELKRNNQIKLINENLHLTDSGKESALSIIRKHRLLEKYFADNTNLNENSWHLLAEEIEHNLTLDEAEKLAAMIGNPVFDPHGDPIPTSDGELPEEKSICIDTLNPGDVSIVTHIEDEPNDIYEKIVSKGIYKGIQIKFLGENNDEFAFYANEKLCSLTQLEVKNVNVGIPKLEKIHLGKFKTLSSLSIGERAKIIGIAKSLRGQQRRRLMDLGIVPGTEIVAELKSISNNPIAYRVKATTIALRKNQTDKIYIEQIN
jgi:DtxR family Mn-dependent transcriptional regulator